MINFYDYEVQDWLNTFDGNSPEGLITSIANNQIKIEVMNDSIHAFRHGEIQMAEKFYKEMWRKPCQNQS